MSLSVAVAGASGYAGGELLRMLSTHPEFSVTTVTAFQNAGQALSSMQPHLRSLGDLELKPTTVEILSGHDVVFFALPHGKSGELTKELPDGMLLVDCGADHRLTNESEWKQYYGGEYFGAWDYGMPELLLAGTSPTATGTQRINLKDSKRIAVPGCNATAVTLGLAPGIRAGLIAASDLVAVLAVGTSGAGKSLRTELLGSEILGSASAYQVGGIHRHNPEIVQNLAVASGKDTSLSFTPVLVPMSRGILATSTATIMPGVSEDQLRAAWDAAYGHEPFIHLLPKGEFPRTADTVGANTVLIGLAVDERANRLVVVSALDNLVKGTAGAAIQSANVALGFDETLGLPVDGVAP